VGGTTLIPANVVVSNTTSSGLIGTANTGQGATGVSNGESLGAAVGQAGGDGIIIVTEYLDQ